MTRSGLLLILTATGLLGGCATAVPVIDFYDADVETLERFPTIDILAEADIASGRYRDLGPVKGLYCSRDRVGLTVHAPRARLKAIDQVKLRAAELGAHAISEPRCLQSRKTDLTNNCWASIVCESTAFEAMDGESPAILVRQGRTGRGATLRTREPT